MRTNIEIDDELIAEAMKRYRLPTKRATVDFALRRLVGEPMSREEGLSLRGIGWGSEDGVEDRLIWGDQLPPGA
jgi:Arc/MetJ family transcription regulator